MLTKDEMKEICSVFENKYGPKNWCLTNLDNGDDMNITKLVVRDRGGYQPIMYVNDEAIGYIHQSFGIDHDLAMEILGSTF